MIPIRTGSTVWEELRRCVAPDRVVADLDILSAYSRDQSRFTDVGRPAALVRARSMADVVATLEVASRRTTPVVTRGAGTGLSGGANAIDGCIVLSTEAIDRIVAVDPVHRTITVECGALNATVAAEAARHGLWYPPDPSSREISTIGGNVATNAGGPCCLKYGVTGDHVAALTAVLADGTVIRTGAGTRKNVAGLDLTRLLVGSEGALAVIVEATLRLRPTPAPPATLAAFFSSPGEAGDAVVAIEQVADPSLLELMDRTTLGAVEDLTSMGLDTGAGALLIAQFDAADNAAQLHRCTLACENAGATEVAQTDDPADGELFLNARRMALPALERRGATLLDDVAVPKPAIPTMLASIESIAECHGVEVGTFGHAGDGNLHPTIVHDPENAASLEAAHTAFDDIVVAALNLGGTITGEHGVGVLKRPYLEAMVGAAERDLMARIKAAFDPLGILNPGKAI